MSHENKEVVLRYVEAFNRGDLDAVCRTFAPDALVYGVLGWAEIAKAREIWGDLIGCFGIQLQVESIVAEGDTVAVRYVERGRSLQSFRGSPITGENYEITAMEWFTVKEGLIQRRWGARDSATMFRQMKLPLP